MELYDAIFKRKATRKYAPGPLDEETLGQVRSAIAGAERLDPGFNLHLHLAGGKQGFDFMKGIVGNLGKIPAPYYLIATSEDWSGSRENAAYCAEQVVLELTRLGLATCWLAGNGDSKAIREAFGLDQSQVPFFFVAFGKPQKEGDQYRLSPSDAKRKEFSQIVIGNVEGKWRDILEAARLAPSAQNAQPWRFFVEGDRVDLYLAKPGLLISRFGPMLPHVDAGIALCHVAVAARHFAVPVKIARVAVAERKDLEYITSVMPA
jgi:nitroreductase